MEPDTADICIRLLSHSPAGLEGRAQFENYRHAVTIDILPDNVFLDIFDVYLCQFTRDPDQRTKKWQILVHVCQRWRSIIFASPGRLDLYLICSERTRVMKNLAYWPVTLPLIVDYTQYLDDEDEVLATLEHPGRVHSIEILGPDSLLKKVVKVMQKPFPALSHLVIGWDFSNVLAHTPGNVPVIPRTFLGRSASQLQHLGLRGISLPHFPALLLSARNLVTLHLENIFQDGHAYLLPEALAEGLAMLPSLTTLAIRFDNTTSAVDQSSSRQDPPIRAILSSLTAFHYSGYSWYLEGILAQLDTPRVDCVKITYLAHYPHRLEHRVLQLSRFVGRTEKLKFNLFMGARVFFTDGDFSVKLDRPRRPGLSLTWRELPVPDSVNTLAQLAATFSNVDHLSVYGCTADTANWLSFLRQFPAVTTLALSGRGVVDIVCVLAGHAADLGTNLLPALHRIWIDDKLYDEESDDEESDDEESNEKAKAVEALLWAKVTLRQLPGRPVTITNCRL